MELNEVKEQPINQAAAGQFLNPITPAQSSDSMQEVDDASCSTCSGAAASTSVSFVYALGRIEARFPNLAVEKEFAQATARADTTGKTDQQTFYSVLSQPQNRYLIRQLCWVLSIQGLET